jgi:hypothetical protein
MIARLDLHHFLLVLSCQIHRMEFFYHNLDELLARGCDRLKDYFVTRPEEKQKLKVCQDRPKSK